jgi:outer membrane protein assembly factor BamE
MRNLSIFFTCLVALSLTACSWSHLPFLYKPDVQQGNFLTADAVAALKIGMNKDQVNYLLGNPVLTDVINTEETQYVYSFQTDKTPIQVKNLSLTFHNDQLIQIEK